MNEEQQIPITATQQLRQKWTNFQQQIAQYSPKIKGKFLFQTLSYDPYIIDYANRGNWAQRLLTLNSQKYLRSYLLYVAANIKSEMQLIVLLHGTNETIFDTQLLAQSTKQQNRKVYRWIELADRHNCVILIPQSRGVAYRNKKYYGWQPGNQDIAYLLKILSHITAAHYLQSKMSSSASTQCSISRQNISIVGFSNGGLFTSDLYMHYMTEQISMQFSILIFINYMGGMNSEVQGKQVLKWNKNIKSAPMVIFTCKNDQNYGPCLKAYQFLQHHQCNVCFVEIDHFKHQFIYEMVSPIYQYISAAQELKVKQNCHYT